MALTATAKRILATLPAYYEGNPFVERIMQARANEIDRADAILDDLATQLIPGQATDEHGLLTIWERQLDLPVAPYSVMDADRQARIKAALSKLDAASSADYLDTLEQAAGVGTFTLYRDTPTPLQDTFLVSLSPYSDEAGLLEHLVALMHPAHRRAVVQYLGAMVPIGGYIGFAGSGDKTVLGCEFLLADGRLLSKTTYAALFAEIGYAYGGDPGGGNFRLPDKRGRAMVGADDMGTAQGAAGRLPNSNRARGQNGGAERHVHTQADESLAVLFDSVAAGSGAVKNFGYSFGGLTANGNAPIGTPDTDVASGMQPYEIDNIYIRVA